MNLTRFAVGHKTLVNFVVFLLVVGGLWSYLNLGRLEDPDFTVKIGVIITRYPGASPEEVELEVTDRIEQAIQEMPQLDGVSREDIEAHGAVSEEVAAAMARGVAQTMGADAGLGVTGVAGPGGGSAGKPVGTVCYAAYFGDRCEVRRERFLGDRAGVRERAAQATMALLLTMLEAR